MTRGVPAEGHRDARYQAPAIDISRRKLPTITATTVPLARTPNQPPRLDDPMAGSWFYHLARQAAQQGDDTRAKEHIAAALKADPNRAHYQWWQIMLSLRTVDTPTLTQTVPAAMQLLLESSLARGRLAVSLHQALVMLTGWFWMILAIALYLSRWKYLAHDLGAMIFKNAQHPQRAWLPLLLPLVFLALRPGWYGFLAFLSVPLLLQTRSWSRGLLVAVWVVALALVYPSWPVLRNAVPTLDPSSEVVLLEEACILPPSGPISSDLRDRLQRAEDPQRKARLACALGIQEARRGNYSRSNKLFATVLELDPGNYSALVGTANNNYYRGRMDDAAERYREADRLHPERGEAPFNLAQVYFKKLFVPEATEALERARSRGFRMESATNGPTHSSGYSPVVYPGLSDEHMAAACRFEAGNYEPLVSMAGWRLFLSSLPWPLFLILGIPLVVATLLVLWANHQDEASECDNCGAPLCRGCGFINDGSWLCSGCGETAQRSQSDMVLATLFKNKSRSEGIKYVQRVELLARLLPGTGHLTCQEIFPAWWRLSLVTLGLFLVCGGWAFDPGSEWTVPGLRLSEELIHQEMLPLPEGNWPGATGLGVMAGLLLLGAAWLVGFTDGPRLRKIIPERTSLVPTGAVKDQQPHTGSDTYQGVDNHTGVR
jgi:Tfp pilus assembly protein PilF